MPIKKAKKSSKGLRKAKKLEPTKTLTKGQPQPYLNYNMSTVTISKP
jgi:hypothetical protein